MSFAINYTENLVTEHCCVCGIAFAFPFDLKQTLLKKKQAASFYCPNGHQQHYTGPNEAERLKAELDRERQRREMAEREAAMEKKRADRMQKRTQAGVCTCCNRSFQNLRRHMQTKHPEKK